MMLWTATNRSRKLTVRRGPTQNKGPTRMEMIIPLTTWIMSLVIPISASQFWRSHLTFLSLFPILLYHITPLGIHLLWWFSVVLCGVCGQLVWCWLGLDWSTRTLPSGLIGPSSIGIHPLLFLQQGSLRILLNLFQATVDAPAYFFWVSKWLYALWLICHIWI